MHLFYSVLILLSLVFSPGLALGSGKFCSSLAQVPIQDEQLALEKRRREHQSALELVYKILQSGTRFSNCTEVYKPFALIHSFEKLRGKIGAILDDPEEIISLERNEFRNRLNALLRESQVSHCYIKKEEKQDLPKVELDPPKVKRDRPKAELAPSLHFVGEGMIPVLKIPSFSVQYDSVRIASLVRKILRKERKGLIIDLRGNGGGFEKNSYHFASCFGIDLEKEGSVDVSSSDIDNFLRKYPNADLQDQQILKKLYQMIKANSRTPSLENETKAPGILKLPPIALLVDQRTASAGEQIALDFRELLGAKLFGSRTKGELLKARAKSIAKVQLKFVFPIADVISREGYRVESNGVHPDFPTTDGEDALRKAINLVEPSKQSANDGRTPVKDEVKEMLGLSFRENDAEEDDALLPPQPEF